MLPLHSSYFRERVLILLIINQGTRQWYLCYHSNMYPVANFVQIDDTQEICGVLPTIQEQPVANSTFNTSRTLSDRTVFTGNNSSYFRSFRSNSTSRGECDPECPNNEAHQSARQSSGGSYTVRRESSPNYDQEHQDQNLGSTSQSPRVLNWGATSIRYQSTPKPDCDLECTSFNVRHTPRLCNRSTCSNANCTKKPIANSPEHPSHNVGHSSHIPRSCIPKPSTYTVPSFIDRPVGSEIDIDDDPYLFGLVKLTDNDVCYTSGTIEWVGRKRSYPVNSGFKTLNEFPGSDPINKKVRRLDNSTLNQSLDKIRECDCADMLPTVNAIVDHLNALHEAVDLIDLRLNTVEDNTSKD